MKELIYFYQRFCPYCRQAEQYVKELIKENPAFESIRIRAVEETKEKELADAYDYYYVPTYFLGKEKLHEGAATKEKIRAVLSRALEE